MSATYELKVEIDGQLLPLNRLFWVRYNSVGCATGSCLGECATTPDQAHKEFTSRQRDRERELRQGYRHELVTKEQWDATVRPCFIGECSHPKPKAGVR
ncbi:hypothetical protein OOK29_09400 [Streptomyces phaeochromogenes]|uniref:hypothetical protein n=1 Tax=Streptomyces phaeochromogenes TaxID=1923 RepID=UPI00225BDC23|nr:hypothetical protein [Streptomyces phaeochromogenes]MCX5598351.1 hypothetical protein [Streptomyces phaeochromogenes]